MKPQFTDRSVSQNDVKKISVDIPVIKDSDADAERSAILKVNKALAAATAHGCGPVHINLHFDTLSVKSKYIRNFPKIHYLYSEDLLNSEIVSQIKRCLSGKHIGIHIGSHRKFTNDEAEAINRFVRSSGAVVFCDHTSNYHGNNKLLISVVSHLKDCKIKPDMVVDIGGITGDYTAITYFKGIEHWRVSEDGQYNQRYGGLSYQFFCSERLFFETMTNDISGGGGSDCAFYGQMLENIGEIIIPEMPLSNTYISYKLSKKLPKYSFLHMSILNSLRNMNCFPLDETIDCCSNVGGFGIDGAVSTLVGHSMVNSQRLYFGLIGDLAFFYDMNALGIRHIKNNLRILLVNNGRGIEFRLNHALESPYGDSLNHFVAAHGHFGSAKAWAESMGFEYMHARDKSEFDNNIDMFCSPGVATFEKSVLFEVFTSVEGELEGLSLLNSANRSINSMVRDKVKKQVGQILPYNVKKGIKDYIKK
jgi:2-succinyl-5-enolpyruvyl-6-hydroxy-3-cyclohexene-1-carboxylate synthase